MFSFLKKWRYRLLVILTVIGPGIITANADNDAGGIATYSLVGANYGYAFLWVLFLITFSLGVTQEMGIRLGIVSGKGLAALIRERFGVKLTIFAVSTLFLANLGTIAAEFSGIAASFELFGVGKYIVVPLAALVVWLVLYKGSFKMAQKIFLLLSSFYIVYVITAVKVKPDFSQALSALISPQFQLNWPFLLTLIALIGTTITPWGQFFIQSYVVNKGVNVKHLKISQRETYAGALMTNVISFFIIVTAANVLFFNNISIQNVADAALALKPLAGNLAQLLFAFGLFCASVLGAFILPMSTAYVLCESFGWEAGFDLNWQKGKNFYSLILISIILPALFVLLPKINLFSVMVISQAINGILLPVILIYLMKLMNDKEIMGKYINGPFANLIAWVTILGLIAASLTLVGVSFFPRLFN